MNLACMRQSDECKVQCQIVKTLVAHGADINAKDDMVCGAQFDLHFVFVDKVVTLQVPQCIQRDMRTLMQVTALVL